MSSANKFKSHKQLKLIINNLKKQGKTIAFTNGCFDILHYGHVKYLQSSKEKADVLIVALNSDSSVRKIKGRARPINKQINRIKVISALSCIDYVTIFNEETPLEVIRLLKPDVLIKGGDWDKKDIVGGDFVETYGGKVVTIPYLKGYSTSKLISKIYAMNRR